MILADRFEIWPLAETEAPFGKPLFGASEQRCKAWVDQRPDADQFIIKRAPACGCCGVVNDYAIRMDVIAVAWRDADPVYRCSNHRDRNPCAVDGCSRTTAAKRYHDDRLYLCAEHWKIACPPRSAERAVYNRLFRLQRARTGKGGAWPVDLDARFWRVWGAIVKRARNETAGDLDMKEINAMFGWAE